MLSKETKFEKEKQTKNKKTLERKNYILPYVFWDACIDLLLGID